MSSNRYLHSRAGRFMPINASSGPSANFSAYPDGTSVASSVPEPGRRHPRVRRDPLHQVIHAHPQLG
ncbi:hypothetical protein [Streptomyces alboflavus]|uniref:hypothetical protein n=1 Tax=Streptomyces alboflavus TaxID=67267 RepID=UPI000AF324E6|nr:hypothetical protein [Streptomyces alboflavus]